MTAMNSLEFETMCDRMTVSSSETIVLTNALQDNLKAHTNCLHRLQQVLTKWGTEDGEQKE